MKRAIGLFAAACLAAACSRPWMYDESGRIDEAMRVKPGEQLAAGVTLGKDAPALARPFPAANSRRGYGRGGGYGRGRYSYR